MPSPPADLTLAPDDHARLAGGAALCDTLAGSRVLAVEGPGALTCLQGLVTCDLAKPGDGTLRYGALLTAKGLIVVDLWVLRLATDRLLLVVPAHGLDDALGILRRSLPPRLARLANTDLQARWLVGAAGRGALAAAGLGGMPDAEGRVAPLATGPRAPAAASPTGWVATGTGAAWFAALVVAEAAALPPVEHALTHAAAPPGPPDLADAAMILHGWPRLGVEIDAKTLVQEVRYDELGGVAYDKGCFVGQETVARLHFRGHTNRNLLGLTWDEVHPLGDRLVTDDGREVATVRSTLAVGDRRVGLALLRREVAVGAGVTAGGHAARVVALPLGAAALG